MGFSSKASRVSPGVGVSPHLAVREVGWWGCSPLTSRCKTPFRGFQRALLLGENGCCFLTVDVKNLNNHTFIDEKLKWIPFHIFAAVVPLSRSTTMHLKRHAQKLLFIGASTHRQVRASELRCRRGWSGSRTTSAWWPSSALRFGGLGKWRSPAWSKPTLEQWQIVFKAGVVDQWNHIIIMMTLWLWHDMHLEINFQRQTMGRLVSPSFPLPQDAFRKVADGDKNAMKNELKKENQQVQDAYLIGWLDGLSGLEGNVGEDGRSSWTWAINIDQWYLTSNDECSSRNRRIWLPLCAPPSTSCSGRRCTKKRHLSSTLIYILVALHLEIGFEAFRQRVPPIPCETRHSSGGQYFDHLGRPCSGHRWPLRPWQHFGSKSCNLL